jgi:predicted RNA binding protein YcfA (HicA-like mRNA interferase family)
MTPLAENADAQRSRTVERAGPVSVQLLEDDGWYLVGTRGSHRQFKHPTKPGRVTVAGKPSDDLHPKTQASILRQAGLRQ